MRNENRLLHLARRVVSELCFMLDPGFHAHDAELVDEDTRAYVFKVRRDLAGLPSARESSAFIVFDKTTWTATPLPAGSATHAALELVR